MGETEMFHRVVAAATAAALIAVPVAAEQMTIGRAIEAASLHEGPLDMVAFYEPTPGGALKVTAAFAPRIVQVMSAAPMRVVLALGDGDDVAFAMPGYPEALYRFDRSGDVVTVSVRRVEPAATVTAGL
jgi:hypothetical protein